MRTLLALVSGAVFFFAGQSASAREGCPVSDKEFLHQITSSSDWTDVHAVFKRNFPACQDEGLYFDGYANLVVGVLAVQWGDLHTLDVLTVRDDAFKKFVLRHIAISAGEDNLLRVLRSAQADCPKNSARLCQEIAARSKRALNGQK